MSKPQSKPQSETKPQWTHVEKGIYKTNNKDDNVRWQVRVAPETNSSKRIKRTVDKKDEAKRLVREAARIRKEGKNVRDAWDAEVGRDGKRRKRVPIEKFFKEYLADCDKRLGIGNKKLPSKGGSGTGLRPATVKSYKSKCRTMARYLEGLSVDYLDELTQEKFEDFRNAMERAGLAETTQQDLLSHLTNMIKARKQHEFPSGFPHDHSKVKAVPPAKPLTEPDDPDKWDGTEFEQFPALPLLDAFRLAEELEPPRRLAVYLAVLMGLRPGELLGLQLDVISCENGRVWLNLKNSRAGSELEIQNQVKTKNSYRKLPVPAVLQDALVGYCTEFHDWDPLSSSKPARPDALLIVGPYGVHETGNSSNSAIRGALERLNMTREHLGGDVTLQHLRRTFLSVVQRAQELTPDAIEAVNPNPNGPDGFVDYGTTANAFAMLGMRVSPRSASEFAGHRKQGESLGREASVVTLTNYNRKVQSKTNPLSNVAAWISLIVKVEKREGLLDAGKQLDWSIPVAKKKPLLTDGDDGWVAYHRFADENGLSRKQIERQINKPIWLRTVIGGAVPTRLVLQLNYRPSRPGSGPPLRLAMRLEHLEMLRTHLATVGPSDLCRRLGFSERDQRAGPVTDYMIEQGRLVPAEHPYSILRTCFHTEEVDRAYQALVVKPFLEQLRTGGAQPPATLGHKLKDLPIFRTRNGNGERHPTKRKEQVERCLEGLEVDGLVRKLRNGFWEITEQGNTHLERNSNECPAQRLPSVRFRGSRQD